MDDMLGRSTAAASAGAGGPFDAYYFEHNCGVPYRRDTHWLTFFGGIADQIVARIAPRRVLDAGCALGILVEALRARGVEAFGVDVSSYAIDNVYEPIRPYCRLASIAEEFAERYDLIVSIEVLEHMPAAEGEKAIANFCRHTDDVLFSSTPGDHRELTHVNVQPPEYWAEIFARHGFFRDVDFDGSFINPWAVRFRKSGEPLPRIVRDYERGYAQLSVARVDARQYAAELQRDLAQALERAAAAEARSERRAGPDQERAHLQSVIAQLSQLAVALDEQRNALLMSRLELDRERERVAHAGEADRAAVAERTAALERERAAVAAKLQDESQQLRTLRASLEETHAHLTRKILELDGAQACADAAQAQATEASARADHLGHELRHARETIQLMEQSAFWRARLAINRALGRRG